MKYDLIKDNQIIKSYDFKGETPPVLAENKGIWLQRVTIKPEYDSATEKLELVKTITETESRWEYVVTQLTAEELATIAAKEAAEATEIENQTNLSTDTLINFLKTNTLSEIETYVANQFSALAGMTDTNIDSYLDTNVTDLASVKSVLKFLAKDLSAVINILKVDTKISVYLIKKELG